MEDEKNDKEQEKSENHDESIIESTIDQIIPGLGSLVKKLKQTSPDLEYRLNETGVEIEKRIKEGYSGKPKISYSCNIRTLSQEKSNAPVKRKKEAGYIEPVVDVIREDSFIRIIAELPGVGQEDIILEIREDSVVLEAKSSSRKYRKVIPVTGKLTLDEQRYVNGIFEARFEIDSDRIYKDGT